MKAIKFFAALAMGLTIAACTPKVEATAEEGAEAPEKQLTAKDVAPTVAERDSVSYLLGVWFGNFLKYNGFGEDINMSQMRKGMADLCKAKGEPQDSTYAEQFKVDPSLIDRMFNDYLRKKQEEKKLVNIEKEKAFFAKLDKDAAIEKSESGLRYIIESEGSDLKAGVRDTVFVHYKLTLPDGKVVEEIPAEASPATLPLINNIAGFKEGLQLIGEGGKIRLYIPSALAYGERGTRGIEPNTPLTFEVTLDKVGVFAAAE